MNKISYGLVLVLTLALISGGCTNYLKLIESGSYDRAFYSAMNKLEGKKNKKVSLVAVAEEAFAKAQSRDFAQLDQLRGRTDESSLSEVLKITRDIERRQNRITPFLPLTDKKGYTAQFDLEDTRHYEEQASEKLSSLYLQEADELMVSAKSGDKMASRFAHDLYLKAYNLQSDIVGIDSKIKESKYYGTTRIHMSVDNQSGKVLDDRLNNTLTTINFSEFRNEWQEFSATAGIDDDYHMVIEIDEIILSPERIVERSYDLKEEIEIKKPKNDTTDQKMTETVYATVTEYTLNKESKINAHIVIRDKRNNKSIHREPVFSQYHYHKIVNAYSGDRRAIPRKVKIGGSLSFPNEADMIYHAGENLKDHIIDYVRQFDL